MNVSRVNLGQENNSKQQLKGVAQIGMAGAVASKGVTSGIRRALGVRIEEHTTNCANAKKIIKDGCILDPKFGGTGASTTMNGAIEKSKGFVHITGIHKNGKENYVVRVLGGNPYPEKSGICSWQQRKQQKLTYKWNSAKPTSPLQGIKELLTTKTFYIGGTDDYFNKNFIPDTDDVALKTAEKLKVHKTKIGATFEALKREGLSGIKQNPNRVIAGIGIAISCALIGYNLLQKGIENIKNNTKEAG